MDELIEEIINIIAAEDNDYLKKYDLKRVIENYTESEIDRRVVEYIEEEQSEAWSNGYIQGKREFIEYIRDSLDDILANI